MSPADLISRPMDGLDEATWKGFVENNSLASMGTDSLRGVLQILTRNYILIDLEKFDQKHE